MAESWIKLHTEILHDPKILKLHPICRYVWCALLLMARSGTPPGTWKAMSETSVASDLCDVLQLTDPLDNERVVPTVEAGVSWMREHNMIDVAADGMVQVVHWQRRQGGLSPSSLPSQVLDRVRCFRQRRREEAFGNGPVTSVTTEENRRERRDKKLQQPCAARGAADVAFENFWTAYPKDRRRGKFEARQAWTRLRLTSAQVAQLMTSLDAWKRSHDWLKSEGKFIPWPQKFLNRRRWEETPDASLGSDRLAPIDYSSLDGGS